MGWIVIVIVLLAVIIGLFALWATRSQSVATLDWIDARWTAGDAELAAAPISYGDSSQQRLFVWAPPGTRADAQLPVIVFFHGGGWQRGDPADYAFVASNFVSEGYVVVVAGYRLERAGAYPAMLEDSAAAVAWTARDIARHGGDPARIAVMGHSAGAYNAVMIALDPRWLAEAGAPGNAIKGAIGLAGPYDFYPFDSDSSRIAFGDAPDPQHTQPIRFARKDAPPLLLMTGSADETVKPRNTRALAAAMSKAGTPTDAVVIDGLGHASILLRLAHPWDRDRRVKDAIHQFLDRAL